MDEDGFDIDGDPEFLDFLHQLDGSRVRRILRLEGFMRMHGKDLYLCFFEGDEFGEGEWILADEIPAGLKQEFQAQN